MDVHNFVYNRAKFSSNARVMFIKINFMLYYKENFIELQKLKKLICQPLITGQKTRNY